MEPQLVFFLDHESSLIIQTIATPKRRKEEMKGLSLRVGLKFVARLEATQYRQRSLVPMKAKQGAVEVVS